MNIKNHRTKHGGRFSFLSIDFKIARMSSQFIYKHIYLYTLYTVTIQLKLYVKLHK